MKNVIKSALLILALCCGTQYAEAKPKAVDNNTVMTAFQEYVQKQRYYADYDITAQRKEVKAYVDAMQYIEKKDEYIQQNRLNGYIADAQDSIDKYRNSTRQMVSEFFATNFPESKYQIADKQACMDSMQHILEDKLAERETTLASLREAVQGSGEASGESSSSSQMTTLIYIGIGLGVLLIIIIILMVSRRGQKPTKPVKPIKKPTAGPGNNTNNTGDGNIVIRRKTMTILKKQTLEDVVDNPAYLKIDCSQVSNDSAVRYLYLKNTCVRDIYNMYAADLQQAGRPAEDGCMVLGRWVHDPEADEYYVSMEQVVMPGDDAVFKEYELNFGGKIKLKMAETLRRLRRETNLQYDLTCWIHSHPSLGVFFSNADSAVHLQLKHPTHPRFLVAFVVDILTADQDLGIFTFRHDESINAKPDLKKMFSLIDLNEWAVASMNEAPVVEPNVSE